MGHPTEIAKLIQIAFAFSAAPVQPASFTSTHLISKCLFLHGTAFERIQNLALELISHELICRCASLRRILDCFLCFVLQRRIYPTLQFVGVSLRVSHQTGKSFTAEGQTCR